MDILKKFSSSTKHKFHIFIKSFILRYFRQSIGDTEFCIISNDCWGGELYKILERPFNTPFVGLMLMSPCYLKLLENPTLYLKLDLAFQNHSKYPSMQTIGAGARYPLAVLGDSNIEIHFLHYKTVEDAAEKWNRRLERINWNKLLVKFDCGKDYANEASVQKFLAFPFENKLIFGKENFGKKEVYVVKNYSADAVIQFRNCFQYFNPFGWLKGEKDFKNFFQKNICFIAGKLL